MPPLTVSVFKSHLLCSILIVMQVQLVSKILFGLWMEKLMLRAAWKYATIMFGGLFVAMNGEKSKGKQFA